MDSERIRLNVGGIIYETFTSTLLQFPDSLLGTMFDERNKHILKKDTNGDVFIDRNGKIFSLILEFYRSAGTLSPFNNTNNNNKFSQQAIHAEVDFFQIPISPPEIKEREEMVGEEITKKAIAAARAAIDQHLYTLLQRTIRQGLNHAANSGLSVITIKFSHLGQTFFGKDTIGTPMYMITNVIVKDMFTIEANKSLLLYDLKRMGLSVTFPPIEPGMITDTIWRLRFILYQ